jgi:hypothetical protein
LKNNRTGLLLLLAGFALLALGIARGEVATVFEKAVRICLECVGIG